MIVIDLVEFVGVVIVLNLLFGVLLFIVGLMMVVVVFMILGL